MENTNINEVVKENQYEEITSNLNANLGSLGMFGNGYDIEKVEGTTKIAAKKTYKLKNKVCGKTELTVRNMEDLKSMETISNINEKERRADLAVCYHLGKLDNKSTLERLGMKSISDIGFGAFEIARTTSTQYSRIGKLFIDWNEELGYHFKSTIIPANLTKGHFIEFLAFISKLKENDESMTDEDCLQYIEDMYLDEYLNDNMSTKTLRKKLKEYRNTMEGEVTEVETEESKLETKESKPKSEESKLETEESKLETEESKLETEESKPKSEESKLETENSQLIITDTLYAIDAIQANFMKLSDSFMEKDIIIDIDSIASALKDALNKLLEN